MRVFAGSAIRSLFRDRAGNFSVMTAFLIPALFGMASVAVNLTNALNESVRMQTALDAAAMAAVKIYGEGSTASEAQAEAWHIFKVNFGSTSTISESTGETQLTLEESAFKLAATEAEQEMSVSVSYSAKYRPIFWGLSPFTIAKTSKAARVSDREVCILALHNTASRAVDISGSSIVDTANCSITSNSNSTESIYLSGNASLKAECLYATGNVAATLSQVVLACGKASEGVSRTPDPFRFKKLPIAQAWVDLKGCGQNIVTGGGGNGDCNGTGKTPNQAPPDYTVTLKPGTYGSLEIKGKVKLLPGDYIIDGGVLRFTSQSIIAGDKVTFFLINGAQINIHGGANFHITASATGTWAGFSIVAASNNIANAVINGNSGSILTGIIYMPASREIQYSGNSITGGECVRIIAQEITIIGNSGIKLECELELAGSKITNPGAIRLVQ